MKFFRLIHILAFALLFSCDSNKTSLEIEEENRPEFIIQIPELALAEQLGYYLLYYNGKLDDTDYARLSDSVYHQKYDSYRSMLWINDSLKRISHIIAGERIDGEWGCYNMRNIYNVEYEDSNRIYHRGYLVHDLMSQKDSMKNFIKSDPSSERMPEFKMKKIQFLGEQPVSKESFWIYAGINDSLASASTWIKLRELTLFIKEVYDEIHDEFSKETFGKPYHELDFDHQLAVNELFPIRIYIMPYLPEIPDPPMNPDNLDTIESVTKGSLP